MKGYKCDRCGEFYKDIENNLFLIKKSGNDIDLCTNCIKALEEFFNNCKVQVPKLKENKIKPKEKEFMISKNSSWNEKQIKLVKDNYLKMPINILESMVSDVGIFHTKGAIKSYAVANGFNKRRGAKKTWSDEQLKILNEFYGKIKIEELQEKINKVGRMHTAQAIKAQAVVKGITKKKKKKNVGVYEPKEVPDVIKCPYCKEHWIKKSREMCDYCEDTFSENQEENNADIDT